MPGRDSLERMVTTLLLQVREDRSIHFSGSELGYFRHYRQESELSEQRANQRQETD